MRHTDEFFSRLRSISPKPPTRPPTNQGTYLSAVKDRQSQVTLAPYAPSFRKIPCRPRLLSLSFLHLPAFFLSHPQTSHILHSFSTSSRFFSIATGKKLPQSEYSENAGSSRICQNDDWGEAGGRRRFSRVNRRGNRKRARVRDGFPRHCGLLHCLLFELVGPSVTAGLQSSDSLSCGSATLTVNVALSLPGQRDCCRTVTSYRLLTAREGS
jgi:hypothetical protein